MQILLVSTNTYAFEVTFDDTAADAKDYISRMENLDQSEVRLYSAGSPLEDDFLLAQLTTKTIDVNVVLKGGKVHGSLSQAGKVKGQTIKVEKREKKKPKTGRAKKRKLYNKRSSNGVGRYGKKQSSTNNIPYIHYY